MGYGEPMRKKNVLPTLLIITDNPSVDFWLKRHLEDQFYLIQAKTKNKALEILKSTSLDFIIVDSLLEDIESLELCNTLRNANPLVPIFLITGRLKKSFLNKALDAGVTDFLNNQLDEHELETRIETGKRAADLREKTDSLSSSISRPREVSSTHLKSKILLHDQALQILASAEKNQVLANLLVLQIDDFTQLRSEKDFSFIEELLLKVNEQIRRSLGKDDLTMPSSGGRFILLTSAPAKSTAKTLQQNIHSFTIRGESLQISLSIATASIEPTEETFNRLIDAAIAALQKAHSTIIPIEDAL